MGVARGSHTLPRSAALRDGTRCRHRRDTADVRRTRELSKTKSRDDGLVTLGRRATARHALTGKGIDVLVRTDGWGGRVETVVSACMKATIWFSSWSVKPSLPMVWSRLFGTSGIGQQSTFSVVPAGQCPDVTLNGNTSRVL